MNGLSLREYETRLGAAMSQEKSGLNVVTASAFRR